jgi:hypothetical protein
MFALSAALEDQKQFLSEDELCDFANAILAMTKIENMARDDYCKTAAYECMSVRYRVIMCLSVFCTH